MERARDHLGLETAVSHLGDRWRASLTVRVTAALVTVLIVSASVTYLVESRLTAVQLRTQAERQLSNDLDVISSRLVDRQSELVTSLRNEAKNLTRVGISDSRSRADLVARLGRLQRGLGLDTVAIVAQDGHAVANVGTVLSVLPTQAVNATAGPARLLPTVEGGHVQAALVSFRLDGQDVLLIGGFHFDDAAAYGLRRLTGNDVVLRVDGQLAGTTVPNAAELGQPRATDSPDEARVVDVDGRRTYVAHRQVARPGGDWAAFGSVGVAMPEPVAQLDRSLAHTRLAAAGGLVLLAATLAWLLISRLSRPLRRLTVSARRIAKGDLSASFEITGEDEIGLLAATLEGMRQSIRTQLAIIRDQAAELQASAERIVGAQAEERRRLAQDLHDGLQRQLVMLQLRLGALRGDTDPDSATGEQVTALVEEVDAAIDDLRAFSQAVYPSILQDRGLTGAIRSLAGSCPIPVDVHLTPNPLPRLPVSLEANAYFIASEATTNTLKHAGATRIEIELALYDGKLDIRVSDDGWGFGEADSGPVRDIPHLQDRARAFGGRCTVVSQHGQGTTVSVTIPTAPDERTQNQPIIGDVHGNGSAATNRPWVEVDFTDDGGASLNESSRPKLPVGDSGESG